MNELELKGAQCRNSVMKILSESGHSKPLAKPDYGLVGNPSTAEGAISKASVDNTVVVTEEAQSSWSGR